MKANPADYELLSPGSLGAVLALISEQPGAWTPIAGGTELMVQFAAGRLAQKRLVNIAGLNELTGVTVGPAEITIGAGVTYTALRSHAELARELPLLIQAAGWTGSIANQNRGTLGGNLVNASPAADSPPALLAYGAELSLISVRGIRRIAYADFHTGYKRTALAPDELVLAVHLPRMSYTHQYIRKVGPRNAQAISKVALAGVLTLADGLVTTIRIGLASVSHAPFRCRNVEAALLDQPLDVAAIERAKAALRGEITPLDDIRSTGRYRVQVAENLLAEFLAGATPAKTDTLRHFNQADHDDAIAKVLTCCGSTRWAQQISVQRPFANTDALFEAAETAWFSLNEASWLEAFAAHPRIGERKAATTDYLAHSTNEQAAAQQTLAPVAARLAELNHVYEERFGFRYIVFANGRSAPELLAVLEERLEHSREEELQEAARQQHRITHLRMTKWLRTS